MKERAEAEGVPFAEYFCFHYLNSVGDRTIRTVRSTHVLFSNSEVYIVGHCELRNEKRVFRASRIVKAFLLETGFCLADFSTWLRNKTPAHQIVHPKNRPLIRETGSGYLSIQTSRGLVYVSSNIFSQIFDRHSISEIDEVKALIKSLPALPDDLANEIVQNIRESQRNARAV